MRQGIKSVLHFRIIMRHVHQDFPWFKHAPNSIAQLSRAPHSRQNVSKASTGDSLSYAAMHCAGTSGVTFLTDSLRKMGESSKKHCEPVRFTVKNS